MKRPGKDIGCIVVRPCDEETVCIHGGHICGSVKFTHSQVRDLSRVYEALPLPSSDLGKAFVRREVMRQAQIDGLRVMGLIARHLDQGKDPVRLVEQALVALGYDADLGEWEEDDD